MIFTHVFCSLFPPLLTGFQWNYFHSVWSIFFNIPSRFLWTCLCFWLFMNDYLAGYQILCQQLSPSVFWRYNSIIFGFPYFWFKDSCPYYFCSFLSFSHLVIFRILYFVSRYFTTLCLSLVSGVLAIFCCASSSWICVLVALLIVQGSYYIFRYHFWYSLSPHIIKLKLYRY